MVDETLLAFGPQEEEELEALCLLASALARLFSYPSLAEAQVFTNEESADFLTGLAERAGLPDEPFARKDRDEAHADSPSAEERGRQMRREFTRLFYRPEAPVPLEGRRWIVHDPATSEARLGETAAAMRCYQVAGLRLRDSVAERADALSTELDFVAYLLEQELAFSHEGNGAQALIWKRRRTVFTEKHLAPLARAVVAGIGRHSRWPLLLRWATLLEAVAERCEY